MLLFIYYFESNVNRKIAKMRINFRKDKKSPVNIDEYEADYFRTFAQMRE